MTEKEGLAQDLTRMADVARGLSKTARIIGCPRDTFIQRMEEAAAALKTQTASILPFQSECPCGRKITVAFVNGQRRVKWSE